MTDLLYFFSGGIIVYMWAFLFELALWIAKGKDNAD